tara:strand:- start:1854 stop:2186 length:333 start_codon:yes stop_codon:yes gene_type:complete
MTTITISLALLGFYILYSTSKRAELTLTYKLQQWARQNHQKGKYLGLGLLFMSLMFSIATLGISSGVFSFLVILMTVGSLIVLIAPLRFFNLSALLIIGLLCFGIELFLN